uniref:Biotin carboxyl carrier protein of acetyl-CoA carboxylase n=1 Tax=Ignavibacterium album TaxID=591197 RepID=A0A832LJ16_9BACT
MDLNLIKKLVKILETSEVTDIEIEENGTKIKVAKKVRIAQPVQTLATVPSQTTPAAVQQAAETKPVEKKSTEESTESNLHTVRSPIVGTFYRAPAPDADPYVQVGDVVSVGTVLCIVEAMKLMNEIESDVNGKIVKILVENGKPVEYNQPLFLIQPM